MKFDNLGALHRHERHLAESRQDLAANCDAGLYGRLGLDAHGDMLFQVARGEVGNSRTADRLYGQRQGHRLLARLDAHDNQRRASARLLGTDHAITAERDPLRLVRLIRSLWAPGLGDIDLAAGRIHGTPKPVRSRSQNTVSRVTRSAATVRFDKVFCCSAIVIRPHAALAPADMSWAPMLSPVRAAAAFSASRTRCAYFAVVSTLEWPSSRPMTVKPSPSASAREA